MSTKSDSDEEEYYSATDSDDELVEAVDSLGVTSTVVVVNVTQAPQSQPSASPKVTFNIPHGADHQTDNSDKATAVPENTPNEHSNSSSTPHQSSHSVSLTVTPASAADPNARQKQREKKLPPPPPAKPGHSRSHSVNDSQISSNLSQRASLNIPSSSQLLLQVQEQNFRNSLDSGSPLTRSSSAHAKIEGGFVLHPAPQPVVEDPEVEFIVKNLDTGESFSSKHIDEFIPKGIDPKSLDPLSFDLWNRSNPTPQPNPHSVASPSSKHKRTTSIDEGKKLFSKLKHKVVSSVKDHKDKDHKTVHTPTHGTNNLNNNNNNNYANGASSPQVPSTPQATSPATPHHATNNTSEKPTPVASPAVDRKGGASKKKQLFAQLVRQHIVIPGGSIWIMRFNYDGSLLAVGGHDAIVRVFKVKEDANSNDFLDRDPILLKGHGGDILSLSWSGGRSNMLLTGSMDSTVRLWNVGSVLQGTATQAKAEVFEHDDVITAVQFHPKNEELFITGCLDNRLRIWNTHGKIVSQTYANTGFVTSVCFTLDGDRVITGSYDGKCTVFTTHGFDYVSEISTQRKKGKKITGIEMMPDGKHFLVTSNDSCIRQYGLADFSIVAKYKGLKNENFQIFATPSDSGSYIVCGSEDCNVFMWEANTQKKSKTFVHDSFQAHSKSVTATMFAPVSRRKTAFQEGQIIVTADLQGEVKIFENKQVMPHSV